MAGLSRTRLFAKETVDGNVEYDYLNTNIDAMVLRKVDTIYVSEGFKYRPDLISYKYYRNYDFGWLLAWYNDFLDPVMDFDVGIKVDIPSIEDYYRFVNRNRKST